MAEPRVTVVMPTYNRAAFIGEALESLAGQERPPDEVIVVDDGSTDDTEERVARHRFAGRIRYERQTNAGASRARNHAVELATGDVIVFLDSDDLLEPGHHLHLLRWLVSHPETSLYCCDARMIGVRGEIINDRTFTEVQTWIKGIGLGSGFRSLSEIFGFSTSFPGMALPRRLYREVGGLDQDVFPLDDWDLQMRMAAAYGGVYYEHRPLARYRVHGSNESGARQGVRVGRQKLKCVRLAGERFPELLVPPSTYRRRLGEVRRELALSLLKAGALAEGSFQLGRSLLEDPAGVRDLVRVLGRRVRAPKADSSRP